MAPATVDKRILNTLLPLGMLGSGTTADVVCRVRIPRKAAGIWLDTLFERRRIVVAVFAGRITDSADEGD